MVQWLRLHTPSARGPGQGIRSHILQLKILCAKTKTQHSQINTQIKKIIKATSNSQPTAFPTYSVNSSAWNVRPSLSLTQCGWAWEGVWSVPVEQGRGYRGVWNCPNQPRLLRWCSGRRVLSPAPAWPLGFCFPTMSKSLTPQGRTSSFTSVVKN